MIYNLDELGLLHGARILWKNQKTQARLIFIWTHPDHPSRDRFLRNRTMYEAILSAPQEEVEEIAASFGETTRTIAKDLPSVFPQLWEESGRVIGDS